jgi:hypothetical protein
MIRASRLGDAETQVMAAAMSDPAFLDLMEAINRIHAVRGDNELGLGSIVPLANFYAWTLENPWFSRLLLFGAALVPIGLGFGAGYYVARRYC